MISTTGDSNVGEIVMTNVGDRPPQDVDVLDFQIPCLRPETPALYSISLLTNHEGHGQKLRHPRRFSGREREFQRSGTARTSTY